MTAYKQAPLEPTPEMVDAACVAWIPLYPAFQGQKPEPTAGDVAIATYRAMLAAAPEPPAEDDKVDKAIAWDTLITRSGEAARLREALTDALAYMKEVRDQHGDSGVGILIRNTESALSNKGG